MPDDWDDADFTETCPTCDGAGKLWGCAQGKLACTDCTGQGCAPTVCEDCDGEG